MSKQIRIEVNSGWTLRLKSSTVTEKHKTITIFYLLMSESRLDLGA